MTQSKTLNQISLFTISIPSSYTQHSKTPALGDESLLTQIREQAANYAWYTKNYQILDQNYEKSLHMIHEHFGEDLSIIIISAHGEYFGGQSYFYTRRVNAHDAIPCDNLLSFLVRSERPSLVFIDACNLKINGQKNNIKSVAMIPSSNAALTNDDNEGYLIQAINQSLKKLHQYRYLRDFIEAIEQQVQNSTASKQEIKKVDFGPVNFLDYSFLHEFDESLESSQDRIENLLIQQSLERTLPNDFLFVFDQKKELEYVVLACKMLSGIGITKPDFQKVLHYILTLSDDINIKAIKLAFMCHACIAYLKTSNQFTNPYLEVLFQTSLTVLDSKSKLSLQLRSHLFDQKGGFHCMKSQWTDAVECFKNSIELKRQLKDCLGVEISRGQLAYAYAGQNQFPIAINTCTEGIKNCISLYKDDKQKGLIKYNGILESVAFHLQRLATLLLITRSPRLSRENYQSYFKLLQEGMTLVRWSESKAPFLMAKMLINLHQGQQKISDDLKNNSEGKIWSASFEYLSQGTLEKKQYLEDLFENHLNGSSWENQFLLLSVGSYIYFTGASCGLEILKSLIQKINQKNKNENFQIESRPWFSQGSQPRFSYKIDQWLDWEFMKDKKQEAVNKDSIYHFSITEQYLQNLFWCAGIVVFSSQKNSMHDMLLYLTKNGFSMTFASCYYFLKYALKNHNSDYLWVEKIDRALKDAMSDGGYNSIDEVFYQRNSQTHNRCSTYDELNKTIVGHVIFITKISQILSDALDGWHITYCDTVHYSFKNPALVEACLRRHDGQCIPLGPLLALEASSRSPKIYVPQILSDLSLATERVASYSIKGKYMCYGAQSYQEITSRVSWNLS